MVATPSGNQASIIQHVFQDSNNRCVPEEKGQRVFQMQLSSAVTSTNHLLRFAARTNTMISAVIALRYILSLA